MALKEGQAGGNFLLYGVGGEAYASPLPNLREVLDVPVAQLGPTHPSPVVRGHTVRLLSLGRLFAVPEGGDERGVTRSLIVVELSEAESGEMNGAGSRSPKPPGDWVGFVVERVHGMIGVQEIYPVPEGITELPEGTVLGAFLLEDEIGPAFGARVAGEKRVGTVADAGEPERRVDAGRLGPGVMGSDSVRAQVQDTAQERPIVLVLDLELLARAADVG